MKIKALILLVGLGTISTVMAKQKIVNLKIIETSDVHGCFFPYDYIENTPMEGSLARVSSYLKKVRKQYGDNVILLENGDILQGTRYTANNRLRPPFCCTSTLHGGKGGREPQHSCHTIRAHLSQERQRHSVVRHIRRSHRPCQQWQYRIGNNRGAKHFKDEAT